ncbi:MAG: phosphatidate cytidylyltransferase [Anaerolineales bacterium]|nr:MAG: phosphatidate cytidylyltransferase [Anaerolineales bacterium]
MLTSNLLALVITFVVALAWLRLNDFLAHRGWVESRLSRKIIHIGTGPLFVLCWILFDADPINKYLAALVPLAFTIQFLLIGTGIMKDEASVKAMSRTGDRREILKGPLYYGIIFVILTVIFWKSTPTGIVALMLMCGGDGLADITGRKWGTIRLAWNKEKSLVGSLGMFFGGWICSVVVIWIFIATGVFSLPIQSYLFPITLIALIGTLVEALPLKDIDNITITLSAVILGYLLF